MLFLWLHQARLAGRGIVCSVDLFVCLSPNWWTQCCEHEQTNSDANLHRWSTWQGHETLDFGVSRSKVKVRQGEHRSQKSLRRDISRTI